VTLTKDLITQPVGKTATFTIAHYGSVTGRVTDYRMTADGVPICYEIDNGMVIPWCNVLTVT